MRLAPAHFHDRPAPAGRVLDLVDEVAGKLGVAELIQILHDNTSGLVSPACLAANSKPSPNSSSSTPRCSNSASVRIADSSSSRWIAKPTWTTTYWPTSASGMYCRHTSFLIPPKSTMDINVPSRSSMLVIFPGTARHMVPPFLDGIAHEQLTQRDSAVVGRNQTMGDNPETVLPQRPRDQSQQQCVLEHAAGQCDRVVARRHRAGKLDHHGRHRAMESGADHAGRYASTDIAHDRRKDRGRVDDRRGHIAVDVERVLG